MQSEWRWCNKCQGLAFSQNQPSVCPAGGNHDHTGSGNYLLAVDDPSAAGQSGWRWCSKCQGLAFSEGLTRPTVCPAGESHDYTESGNYTLAHEGISAPGQSDWRWCNKCQGLAFSLNQRSVCPAGGQHDHTGSGNYKLASIAEVAPGPVSGLVSEEAVPPGATSGAYWPGEVDKSKKSGGKVLDVSPPETGGEGAALLSDFVPSSAELRPAHRKLIGIIRTRMGWPSGRHDGHLLEVFGMMDEIEGFSGGSVRLDTARAFAVKRAFDSTGVFITMGPSTTRPGQDDPDVLGLGVNPECVGHDGSSPEKRAAGRSVSVKYSVPAGTTIKPDWPADKKSRRWAISQMVATNFVVIGGWVDIGFEVKNLESGREYVAHFSGSAKGAALGLSFHMLGHEHNWSEFATDVPIAAPGLDGPKTVYEVVAGDMEPVPVGGSLAFIKFGRLRTTPRKIALHNAPEISLSPAPFSAFVAEGTFTVLWPK